MLFIVKVTAQVLVTVVRIEVLVVVELVVVVEEVVELVVFVEVVDVLDEVVKVDEVDVGEMFEVVEDELAWTASTNQIADSPGLSIQLPVGTWV